MPLTLTPRDADLESGAVALCYVEFIFWLLLMLCAFLVFCGFSV